MTIRRPDGSWIFHFVNVVDDIEMKITHVIRGEDHLTNTAKHPRTPQSPRSHPSGRYAHIPLILNHDGSKMKKRDHGAGLPSYIENGFLPEALGNYLCLLGGGRPRMIARRLPSPRWLQRFELSAVNRKNAAFDLDKCTWLNSEYMKEVGDERFQAMGREALERAAVGLDRFPPEYIRAALGDLQRKAPCL